MCGICGFTGDLSEEALIKMSETIIHRGPDDFGTYLGNNIGLAHRRLSIIDIESGHQPMSNEDGSIWIVFNGEIYNFQELKNKYLAKHSFRTRSDTEVIIHLYEEFGEKCVEYLRGMFAFAIWDEKKKKLFIARDRFGIKPLYYKITDDGVVFASELKAVLETGFNAAELNKLAINHYLAFRYVPGSATMIQGVEKLEPAHYMVWENGRITINRYWELSFDKITGKSEKYYSDILTEVLRESIDIRLISEVPLGAYLSGGLDSSFMVGLMSGIMSNPVKTFTAGFNGGWHDESSYADIIAGHFNTDHRLLKTDGDAAEILEKVVWHLDEPLGDAATIPTYLLSELTKEYVTVILSGEGADELLAGYDKYKLLCYVQRISGIIPGALFQLAGNMFSGNIKLKRGFELLSSKNGNHKTYVDLVSVFNDEEKKLLFGPGLKELECQINEPEKLVEKLLSEPDTDDYLDRLMYLDIKTWLPNDVLLKNDKMTMAHSLEARVPFLDHIFAEAVMKIPGRLKLKWFKEKYILRKSMRGVVPKSITKRRKHGFTVPVEEWMQKGLKKIVDDLLSEENIENSGYWNYEYIRKLRGKNLNNTFYRRQFWAIVAFEMWRKVFIEGVSR